MLAKNIKINSVIIILYSLIFLSINSTAYDIFFFFNSKFSFVTAINCIRSILPFIIILFFLFLISYNYFLKKKKLTLNIIIIFFSIFILLQIIGYLLNPKNYQNLYEYKLIFQTYENTNLINSFIFFDQNYYLLSLFSVLLFYSIITSYYQSFKVDYLLIVSVLLLSIYNIPIASLAYKNFLLTENFSTYATGITDPSTIFFNGPVPRSTGAARSMLIIYIFVNTFLFYKYNKNNNKLLFINIILGTLIWSFQSRIILALKIVVDVLSLFFLNKKLVKKITLFLFITLIPIIIHNVIIFSKNEISRTAYLTELKKFRELKNWNTSDNLILRQNRIIQNNTSGRTKIWHEILLTSKNSLVFGYGSQGDRWYINRNDPGLNNASSSLFYSLICGGVMGVTIYILITISTIRILLIYYIKNILRTKETIFSRISLFIIISLLLRSIVENSFMFFGVDNMLFLSSYLILNHQIKKNC